MEASLRFAGPETRDQDLHGFGMAELIHPAEAVGERGALTLYGKPDRPVLTGAERNNCGLRISDGRLKGSALMDTAREMPDQRL
jgi:hypothetical protein